MTDLTITNGLDGAFTFTNTNTTLNVGYGLGQTPITFQAPAPTQTWTATWTETPVGPGPGNTIDVPRTGANPVVFADEPLRGRNQYYRAFDYDYDYGWGPRWMREPEPKGQSDQRFEQIWKELSDDKQEKASSSA